MDLPGFREFVEIRYVDLLRTAFLLTGARDTAEDLVQAALLTTMRHWESVAEPMAYVRRAMVNRRTSLWRRIGSREVLTAVLPEHGTPDGTAGLADRDELLAALGRLPARMRAVLVLRYWEDLSETETARLLGCSVGTVKSQASRGLDRLRLALAPPPPPDEAPATAASQPGGGPAPGGGPVPGAQPVPGAHPVPGGGPAPGGGPVPAADPVPVNGSVPVDLVPGPVDTAWVGGAE